MTAAICPVDSIIHTALGKTAPKKTYLNRVCHLLSEKTKTSLKLQRLFHAIRACVCIALAIVSAFSIAFAIGLTPFTWPVAAVAGTWAVGAVSSLVFPFTFHFEAKRSLEQLHLLGRLAKVQSMFREVGGDLEGVIPKGDDALLRRYLEMEGISDSTIEKPADLRPLVIMYEIFKIAATRGSRREARPESSDTPLKKLDAIEARDMDLSNKMSAAWARAMLRRPDYLGDLEDRIEWLLDGKIFKAFPDAPGLRLEVAERFYNGGNQVVLRAKEGTDQLTHRQATEFSIPQISDWMLSHL